MKRKIKRKVTSRLWYFRASHGLTQQQLADRVRVTRNAIQNIESGRSVPSVLVALELAEEFKASVHDLFRIETAVLHSERSEWARDKVTYKPTRKERWR